ncbi:MAG: hypothetical protein F6K11_09905 [Leptolyngbya sp. SIO3F4]|nr:hypothetical protein [Leptolyngbya sp. SIO3F4]
MGQTNLLHAQLSHYWTQGAGARSTLLGGAVVGHVEDNSAIFYNPAGLNHIQTSQLSLNANVYGISYFNLRNGGGSGIDMENVRALLYPQLISGIISPKRHDKVTVGFGLSTRHFGLIRLAFVENKRLDLTDLNAGNELYLANFEFEGGMDEQWGTLAFGLRVNDEWKVGVSNIVSYRNQKSRLYSSVGLHGQDGSNLESVHALYTQRTVIDVVSLLWKLGVQYKSDTWSFGMTMTTPKLRVFGFSNSRIEIIQTGFAQLGLSRLDQSVVEQSSDVQAYYRQPWSFAVGLAHNFERSEVFFTAEFFTGIEPYDVLEVQSTNLAIIPNSSQRLVLPPGDESLISATSASRPILNVAVGYEYRLNESYELLSGFRTNYNYYDGPTDARIGFDSDLWDMYHLSFGFSKKSESGFLSVGLDNAFGYRRNIVQPINYSNPVPDLALTGFLTDDAQAFSYVGTLIVGYTRYF